MSTSTQNEIRILNILKTILQVIGHVVLGLLAEIGRLSIFAKDALFIGLTPRYHSWQILTQLFVIGYTSLPVVALTAFFTGGALALQIYTGSSATTAATLVPSIVAIGITRELGPVLAGLMVSGRVGASIAAELGTMKVTEQTDALITLSTNPFKYLVGPRMIAAVLSLPVLVFIGDIIGIMGGYVIGTRALGFNGAAFLKTTADTLHSDDVTSGLIKAAVFGFIIALMGCYHGFNSKGGAAGVGRATTNAVVSSAILILAANFMLTSLLFGKTLMAEPFIKLTDLRKAFGPKHVLNGINLSVEKGRSLVVIGGSGTGKSVMLKCILGILQPDSGAIEVGGQNALGLKGTARDEFLHRFGMLFQGGALFDSLCVWENVAFGLIQGRGMERAKARDVAMEKLGLVGLSADVGALYPAELSGGMQKRVGLARAIAADPEIIFFDEPTTGLDPIMADVINNLIVDCVKRLGATTISITHDMASARKIGDDIAMIYKGEIIWQGVAKMVDRSGSAYVDQFIHGKADGPIQMDVRKG